MKNKLHSFVAWCGSAALGVGCAALAQHWNPASGCLASVWAACKRAYDLVGIMIIGLLPFGIWALRLTYKLLVRRNLDDPAKTQLDFAYIGRNATVLGLLGTVIALATAGAQMAQEVAQGSAAAVLRLIPCVGQALIATVLGLVIAFLADTALHIMERRQLREGNNAT
jgi:biopolymer transport protein ExbB/TolQ